MHLLGLNLSERRSKKNGELSKGDHLILWRKGQTTGERRGLSGGLWYFEYLADIFLSFQAGLNARRKKFLFNRYNSKWSLRFCCSSDSEQPRRVIHGIVLKKTLEIFLTSLRSLLMAFEVWGCIKIWISQLRYEPSWWIGKSETKFFLLIHLDLFGFSFSLSELSNC